MSKNSIAAPAALDSRISIATVYRTVRLLEEKGILERRDFGGGRARYEPTEHGHHYHLIDVDTGKVIEFQDPEHEAADAEHCQAAGLRPGLAAAGAVRPSDRSAAPRERRSEARQRRRRRTWTDHASGQAGAVTAETRPPPAFPLVVLPLVAAWRPQWRPQGGPWGAPGGQTFPELRAGHLGVRLAVTNAELDAVQALRYRVFYLEMGAAADPATAGTRRDRDDFDAVADHLLVIDHAIGSGPTGWWALTG